MANIQDVVEIRSISRFGLSVVTIVFKDQVDIFKARQRVSEQIKMAESQIPSNYGRPEMMPVTTGLGEIYQYVVEPRPGYEKVYSLYDLRTLAEATSRSVRMPITFVPKELCRIWVTLKRLL